MLIDIHALKWYRMNYFKNWSEMLQNEEFHKVYVTKISSPRLKKIGFGHLKSCRMTDLSKFITTKCLHYGWGKLDFNDMKCIRIKGSNKIIVEYLHQGSMLKENFAFWWSETPKWTISTIMTSLPWLKKILHFGDLKCSRIKDGWRKFWSSIIWNSPEWRISTILSDNIFTMVDK